jgi:fructose-1,6-bisphosphatase/inositol monophosphatase family enzyme
MSNYSFVTVAEEAALTAGAYIKEHLGGLTTADISEKQAADYVTVVDTT